MRKVVVFIVLAFLVGCCFFSGVSNPIEKVGINETGIISTGGLQNSSWPMFHHDTRHTGRSPYGPVGNWPSIKWKFRMEGRAVSSPAIDENSTIYIGAEDFHKSFFAINPDGTEKWRFNAGHWVDSSPALSSDGTVYFGSYNGYLYALYPNGTVKWLFGIGWSFSSPTIGTDGTIYIGSHDHYLHAMNPNGTQRWRFGTGGPVLSSAAIDDNGIIYIGSHDHYLYAVYPNGTLKWKYQTSGEVKSPPSIGDDGTIYIAAQFDGSSSSYSYLYALELINNPPPSTPTIDGPPSGKVKQNYDYTIVSTDPEGNNISYYVDWGDGTNTGWIGPYPSGDEQTVSHTWNKKGTYTIQVKAKDNQSAESEWETLKVTMPKNSNVIDLPFLKLLERFFERYPFAFPILRYLLII